MPKSFLQKTFFQTLLKATRLTGQGSLMDATRAIQRALAGLGAETPSTTARRSPAPDSPLVTPLSNRRPDNGPVSPTNDVTAARPAVLDEPLVHKAPTSAAKVMAPATRPGAFSASTLQFKGEPYVYWLYVPASTAPSNHAPEPLPLVVLLHGCQQNALDFAKGTDMNRLADLHQVVVLYPEQRPKANSGGCWNWFEPTHQTRSGEPGMVAALTRKIIAASQGDVQIDPHRVYIAGLSAGGAMSAVVAELYPDIFAAVGVHSGLPAGAAQSMIGAFGAMRRGGPVQTTTAMPTIIFHGTADTTVHPANGSYVSDAACAALGNSGLELVKTEQTMHTKGHRSAQRVMYLDNSGKPFVEHWRVSDGGHAWFGGDASGSYTDPQGPSASKAMLTFFLQHTQRTEP